MRPHISKFTIVRWLDIICLTIVAVLICCVLYPQFQAGASLLTEFLTIWPSWMQYSIISLLSGLLWIVIIRLGGFRFSDLFSLKSVKYPPVWFCGIFGAIIYLFLIAYVINTEQVESRTVNLGELGITGSAIVVGLIVAGVINNIFLSHAKKSFKCQRYHAAVNNNIADEEQVLSWLSQEIPIEHPAQDRFGLSVIAERIAHILLSELKTVGIIGPYGIGKSSLLSLVEYYLTCNLDLSESLASVNNIFQPRKRQNMLFCRIDGWGRYSGSVAQQILTTVVNRLSLEVDCLSVLTVPANYRAALSSSRSAVASIISALLHTDEEPAKTLSRLDRILQAVNMQYVILLEDFDRTISDTLILDELPALLDRLHVLKNISFVFAISTERGYSHILTRICDHVESLS